MTATLVVGKAKIIHPTDKKDVLIAEFKDDLTAFNNKKKSTACNKGKLNAEISEIIFRLLERQGIKTHLISRDENKLTIEKLKMIPIEVVVRNIAAGSIAKNYNITKGQKFEKPIVEYYFKNDDLNDPQLNENHIISFGLVRKENDLNILKEKALEINSCLVSFYREANLAVVDFKLEFGYSIEGDIVLGDEMSPDNMRLWDIETGSSLDKDIFREDLGDITDTYTEVLSRIKNLSYSESGKSLYTAEVKVSPRKDILDPQGKAAFGSLKTLGFNDIEDVRVGKYIEVKLKSISGSEARDVLSQACEKLLANTVIEDYSIEIR